MKPKFRAWDKENKKMLEVSQWCIGGAVYVIDGPDLPDRRIEVLDHELMQSTGLLDKNCKEVWEGDAVKLTSEDKTPVVVTWLEGAFRVEHKDYLEFMKYNRLGAWVVVDIDRPHMTVVGNIYESPELLT